MFALGLPLLATVMIASDGPVQVRPMLADDRALAEWVSRHVADVVAARERVEQARADLRAARLFPNPTLDGSLSDVNVTRSNPPGLDFGQTAIWNGGLTETVEIAKRGPRISAARDRLASARADLADEMVRAIASARAALGNVVAERARVALLEDGLDAARAAEALERTRMEHGDLSGNDYDRLVLDDLVLEASVAQERAESDAAVAECGAALGAPCSAGDAGVDDLAKAAPLMTPVADAASIDAALATRADLRSLALQEEASHRDATLARRRAVPDVAARLGYTHDALTISGDQENTVGVTLSVPVPLFDRGQADAARAEARARELAATRAQKLADARAELAGLLSRHAQLRAALDRLVADGIDRSRGVLATTQRAFDLGQVSLTDLLLARREDREVQLRRVDLERDLFLTRNDLRRALSIDAPADESASP